MILKNIAKLCKARKRISLFENPDTGCQWIGDGCAVYPLYGMPELDDETVFAILDIPEDKRDGYQVVHTDFPESLDSRDEAPERLLQPSDLGLVYKDQKLMPARTSLGCWFYNPAYLEPLKDLESFELYEREMPDGQIYLAVKTGFMLRAIILPKLPEPEKLAEQLQTIFEELIVTLSLRAQKKAEEEEKAYSGLLTDEASEA